MIEGGQVLPATKDAMPHRQFGPCLRAEFGWGQRTAQNFTICPETAQGPKLF